MFQSSRWKGGVGAGVVNDLKMERWGGGGWAGVEDDSVIIFLFLN